MKKESNNKSDVFTELGKAFFNIMRFSFTGIGLIFKNREHRFIIFSSFVVTFFWGFKFRHLVYLNKIFPDFFHSGVCLKLMSFGGYFNGTVVLLIPFVLATVLIGLKQESRKRELEEMFDSLKINLNEKCKLKVMSIKDISKDKMMITVKANGVSKDDIQGKKKNLLSSLGYELTRIRHADDRRFFNLDFCKKFISEKVNFEKFEKNIPKNGFIIGEGLGEFYYQKINELPHCMIAGTTGGGKSNYFKQAIIGLLQSSPKVQMYLFDLKEGVEFNDFSHCPNVFTTHSVTTAKDVLLKIEKEMLRRYSLMRKKEGNSQKLDDYEFDRIIICVDEASILYEAGNKSHELYDDRKEAMAVTSRIAKLGRSAGVHLMIATQKISKNTLGTDIQENITGRICFQMNTVAGSTNVIGNKMASDIEALPGRAVWSKGVILEEVQTPYLSDEVKNNRILKMIDDFEAGRRSNYQEMIYSDNEVNRERKSMRRLGNKV